MSRLLFLVVAVSFSAVLLADNFVVLNQAEVDYGNGVHAYFSRDYKGALELFQKVEKLGSKDPRPYFFYGLTLRKQKDLKKSEEYFKKAAELEFDEMGQEYEVSEALRRVQGKDRLLIEQFREAERAKWQEEQRRIRTAKFGERKEKQQTGSFVQPNPAQEEPIIRELAVPRNNFGAAPIMPEKPSAVAKILPRVIFNDQKITTGEEKKLADEANSDGNKNRASKSKETEKDSEGVNPFTEKDSKEENPFTVTKKKKGTDKTDKEDDDADNKEETTDKDNEDADADTRKVNTETEDNTEDSDNEKNTTDKDDEDADADTQKVNTEDDTESSDNEEDTEK